MAAKLLEPVVQEIWPMVNVRPPATAAEVEMMTILLALEAILPGTPLSTKDGQQST